MKNKILGLIIIAIIANFGCVNRIDTNTEENIFKIKEIEEVKAKLQEKGIKPTKLVLYKGSFVKSKASVISGKISTSATKLDAVFITFEDEGTNTKMFYLKTNGNTYIGTFELVDNKYKAVIDGTNYKVEYFYTKNILNKLFFCINKDDFTYNLTLEKKAGSNIIFSETEAISIFDGGLKYTMNDGTTILSNRYLLFFEKNTSKYLIILNKTDTILENAYLQDGLTQNEYTNNEAGEFKIEWNIYYTFDGQNLTLEEKWKPTNVKQAENKYTLVYGPGSLKKTN